VGAGAARQAGAGRVKALLVFALAVGLLSCPTASANPIPGHPNCDGVPWGFLGSARRILCDGPVGADGSWVRARLEYIPAHYVPATTSCSGGSYSTYCSSYPGGWVDDNVTDEEQYVVTPQTVLPDEPGHLG